MPMTTTEEIQVTTMTRTDEHRPAAFSPADYTWVGYTYEDGIGEDARSISDGPLFGPRNRSENVVPTGARMNWIHPGGCDHCGHRPLKHRYWYRHDPTGDVIVLGWDCAEKTGFDSREAMEAAQRVKARQIREAAEQIAAAWKAANPEVAEALELHEEHHILADMRRKLNQYGSLSDKQGAFALTLAAEVRERRENPPEVEEFEPIPAEIIGQRVVLTGEILTMKWKENPFGGSMKILLKDDRGFKVWGTLPSALDETSVTALCRFPDGHTEILKDRALFHRAEAVEIVEEIPVAEAGSRVAFTAKVEASRADKTFGFFSRPTKAALLDAEETS